MVFPLAQASITLTTDVICMCNITLASVRLLRHACIIVPML